MLSDQLSQLLTAYIDGELSSRQKRAVQKLLRKSREARTVLQRLQEDARALRGLSRPRLDHDLSAQVLRTISDRRLHMSRRAALAQRPPFPAWVGYMAAASVLFVVFCGSYLYFYSATHGTRTVPLAQKDKEPAGPEAPEKQPIAAPTHVAQRPEPIQAPKLADPEDPKTPGPAPVAVTPTKDDKPPMVRPTPDDPKTPDSTGATFGKTSPKLEVFTEVNVRDTLSLALWELEKDKGRKQLRDVLDKDLAHRIELMVKGGPKGFGRLEAAFKAHGVRLLVDKVAQARLKGQQQTNYVLFAEDLTPEEVAKILETVGIEDKKAETQKRGDGQFGQVFVLPLTQDDHKELASLLHQNPLKLDPPAKGPLGVDLRKPVSSNTAQQVQQALAGQGTPRPAPGQPVAVVPLTRQAIVVTYNPVRPPTNSAEVKQYMAARTPKRPGTLQILLVLRAGNR